MEKNHNQILAKQCANKTLFQHRVDRAKCMPDPDFRGNGRTQHNQVDKSLIGAVLCNTAGSESEDARLDVPTKFDFTATGFKM